MKTPGQHRSRCSSAFIVGFEQILNIGFHAYLTYFRSSYLHYFQQVNATWEGYQKLKKNRWFNTLLKFSVRKSFGVKKLLQTTTMIQEYTKYCTV